MTIRVSSRQTGQAQELAHLRTPKNCLTQGVHFFLKLSWWYRPSHSVVNAYCCRVDFFGWFEQRMQLKFIHRTHKSVFCVLFSHKQQVGTVMSSARPCWSVLPAFLLFPLFTADVLVSQPHPFLDHPCTCPTCIVRDYTAKLDQTQGNMHMRMLMQPIFWERKLVRICYRRW